jgi:dTDP-4-amino-4,6-dideoxygalactose transaminase
MGEKINMIDLKREIADIGVDIRAAVDRSFADTIFINGPRVKEFEAKAAEFLNVKHAIGVANGTDALHIALLGMGIKAGDEIITTPFTFYATAEACAYIGAKPVFVDIDEETMNIDVSKLEEAVTHKTKAILPVHIFGNPANMPEIMAIANKYHLQVLEDCAQSFGATIGGKMTGTFGSAGTISFYPTKNLGAYGDAGMVITNSDDVAALCKKYREHGSSVRYYHELIGYNSRLDDIQAAILGVKIEHIDRFNAERRRIAAIYKEQIGDSVIYQAPQAGGYHIYHQFTIRAKNRQAIMDALAADGIASAIFYPVPCHMQESMAHLGYKRGDLPITDKISDEVLSLPINPYLTDDEVARVAKIVKNVAERA